MTLPSARTALLHPSVVVDTSVWVSIIAQSDSNHVASIDWWHHYTAAGGTLIAPEFVVVEVAAAIARRTRNESAGQQAAAVLVQSGAIQFVPADTTLILDAADLAARLFLKGADSLFVAVAHQKKLPLVSWDAEQRERATATMLSYKPDDFPFAAGG